MAATTKSFITKAKKHFLTGQELYLSVLISRRQTRTVSLLEMISSRDESRTGRLRGGQLRLPGRDNWNIALFKTFPFNRDGKVNLQFRADAYNTFNHTQFQNVDAGFNDAQFGQVTSTWDPRVFQLSLRLAF